MIHYSKFISGTSEAIFHQNEYNNISFPKATTMIWICQGRVRGDQMYTTIPLAKTKRFHNDP